VKRELAGGYELDDDPARVDVDAVHDFLANSYWAKGRPRDVVERHVREAARVVGVYLDGAQVGYARAFSDGVALAYLADVYILDEHRGRGLGVELVREMVENSEFTHVKWMLHTRVAHDLYRRFGFGDPSGRVMERRPSA
jgi:GNAT superfamily N-acetyltransferase